MRISDWSSDVCSSDLPNRARIAVQSGNKAEWCCPVSRVQDVFLVSEVLRINAKIDPAIGNIPPIQSEVDQAISWRGVARRCQIVVSEDRKSTRLNSSH